MANGSLIFLLNLYSSCQNYFSFMIALNIILEMMKTGRGREGQMKLTVSFFSQQLTHGNFSDPWKVAYPTQN